ncbi:MAG: hypothetical protein LBK59_11300 [Bifidobacteriaceae bacterium]|nr:hypothetical protein [Bifidobacteriaceae bacterium]
MTRSQQGIAPSTARSVEALRPSGAHPGAKLRLRANTMFSSSAAGIRFSNTETVLEIAGASAYRAFKAIAPILDGSYSRHELAQALDQRTWRKVEAFVEPLLARGFLREIDPCPDVSLSPDDEVGFAEQLAFIAHFKDDPKRRFVRFRDASIAVVGGCPLSDWLSRVLVKNGSRRLTYYSPGAARPDDLPDSVQIRPLDRLDHDVAQCHVLVLPPTAWAARRLAQGGDGFGAPVTLPITALGDNLVIGPMWAAGDDSAATWADMMAALSEHDSDGSAAHFWVTALAGVETGATATGLPAVQRFGASLAAIEVYRNLTGISEPETADSILVLDCLHGEAKRHRVIPHRYLHPATTGFMNRCPASSLPAPSDEVSGRVGPSWSKACTQAVDPLTLPIMRFDDGGIEQLPLKVSVAEVVLGGGRPPVTIGSADLWDVAGARARATRQALALRLETWAPPTASGVEAPTVDGHLHGRTTRDQTHTSNPVLGRDLLTGEKVAVPSGAVATMSSANALGIFGRSALGCGIGLDHDEALEGAVSSAAARLGLIAAARAGAAPHATASDASPKSVFLRDAAQRLGVVIESFDAGRHLGRHVVISRCQHSGVTAWEAAAGSDLAEALCASLVGLIGAVQRAAHDKAPETWSMTAEPGFDPNGLVTGTAPPEVVHNPRVIVCDVTNPELAALGFVAVKALTADGSESR